MNFWLRVMHVLMGNVLIVLSRTPKFLKLGARSIFKGNSRYCVITKNVWILYLPIPCIFLWWHRMFNRRVSLFFLVEYFSSSFLTKLLVFYTIIFGIFDLVVFFVQCNQFHPVYKANIRRKWSISRNPVPTTVSILKYRRTLMDVCWFHEVLNNHFQLICRHRAMWKWSYRRKKKWW